jgi:hypothetical protein
MTDGSSASSALFEGHGGPWTRNGTADDSGNSVFSIQLLQEKWKEEDYQ